MTVNPEPARMQGCSFYKLPDELAEDDIDPLIRDAVFRINKSGWVWTAASCQGHPDAAKPIEGWQNVRPYLRLVTPTERLGDMLATLLLSMRVQDTQINLPMSLMCELRTTSVPHSDYTEVEVYVKAITAYDRDLGIRAFDQFANAVSMVAQPV